MERFLLPFLLFLTFSLQIHARESRFFFSKTSRAEASPKVVSTSIAEGPSTVLPPESYRGYGLYGRDPDQFPSSATVTNYNYNSNKAAYREPSTIPSSFSNSEFSNYENKERNANNIPSSFANAEFSTGSYENNKERNNANSIPSSFDTNPEFPTSETYENKEYSNSKNYPSTVSKEEEFNRGSYETKVPNFSYYDTQYGMSDTRFLENGKYFYDVNAERNSREYEPMKGERYGNYGNNGGNGNGNGKGYGYEYKNEVGGYQNGQENQERQEEYDP